MSIDTILNQINSFVWGPPLLILISGVGLYLTFSLKGIQLSQLGQAFRYMFKPEKGKGQSGDISAFAALSTALAATIGTGILSAWQPLFIRAGLEHYFGCG